MKLKNLLQNSGKQFNSAQFAQALRKNKLFSSNKNFVRLCFCLFFECADISNSNQKAGQLLLNMGGKDLVKSPKILKSPFKLFEILMAKTT